MMARTFDPQFAKTSSPPAGNGARICGSAVHADQGHPSCRDHSKRATEHSAPRIGVQRLPAPKQRRQEATQARDVRTNANLSSRGTCLQTTSNASLQSTILARHICVLLSVCARFARRVDFLPRDTLLDSAEGGRNAAFKKIFVDTSSAEYHAQVMHVSSAAGSL